MATATLASPTRIMRTGLKRTAQDYFVGDEVGSLLQLDAIELPMVAHDVELQPSAKGGEAVSAAPTAKRIRPTREGVRRGKWTTEEQKYADRLISDFEAGLLPLKNGATLRAFLSKKLNCDPMRISKKFAGAKCLGKQIFLKKSVDGADDGMVVDGLVVDAPVMTAETMLRREEELQRLEADFLKSITAIANGSNSRRRNRNSAAKKKAAAAAAAAAAASVPHDDELAHDNLSHHDAHDSFGFDEMNPLPFSGLAGLAKSPKSVADHRSESDSDQGVTSNDDISDEDDATDSIALPDYMVMPKLELGNSSDEELCYQGQDASGMPRLCYDSDHDGGFGSSVPMPMDGPGCVRSSGLDEVTAIREAMDSLSSYDALGGSAFSPSLSFRPSGLTPGSLHGSSRSMGTSASSFSSNPDFGVNDDLGSTLTFLGGDETEVPTDGGAHESIEPLGDFLPDECFMMEPL